MVKKQIQRRRVLSTLYNCSFTVYMGLSILRQNSVLVRICTDFCGICLLNLVMCIHLVIKSLISEKNLFGYSTGTAVA